MNTVIYLVGTLIVIGALAYGASIMGVDAVWIGIGAAVCVGLGVMTAVTHTRQKE